MRLENQRKLLLILVLLVAVVALWYVKQNREGRIIIGKPPVAGSKRVGFGKQPGLFC